LILRLLLSCIIYCLSINLNINSKLIISASIFLSLNAIAKSPAPYGPAISLEQAKIVVAAAEAEAIKNNWAVAIVVADSGGNLVLI